MKKIWIVFLSVVSLSPLLGNNINWSFPPDTLSSPSFNATDAQIAIDASGDLIAAWVENGMVKASTKQLNLAWTSPVAISGSGASFPRIVSDNSGNGTAVWLENGVVKAASKLFNGSWSSATTLSGTNATMPHLAVDGTGDVVAVWARNGSIEASTKLFGLVWQNHVTITSTNAAFPKVAFGGTGTTERAVVVWNGTNSGANVVYASTKLVTGNWSAQQLISDTSHQAGFANVAVDMNSNAVAVWYAYDVTGSVFSNVNVQTSSRPVGTGVWSAPKSISTFGMRDPSTLTARIGFDSTGNAVALWNLSFDDQTFDIESAVKPINGQWSAPVTLLGSNLFAMKEDLAVISFGDALTAFLFDNGVSQIIQVSESDTTGFMQNAWSVPNNLSSGLFNAFPRVAASTTGNMINAAVVWLNYNGVKTTVQALTGTRSVVLPPSNLSVTQGSSFFGAFTEFFNVLSWNASLDPNLAGYLIYRNGTFIAQVGAGVTQFVDDNRVQNGSVTYGVAAINTQNSQSQIITVNFP